MWKHASFAFFLFLTLNEIALADNCKMVGCVGTVGYLFIPNSQIYFDPNKPTTMNGKNYDLEYDKRVFKTLGLPKVNSIATLSGDNNELFDGHEGIRRLWEELQKPAIEYDDKTMTAKFQYYSFQIGGSLSPGAKLRILGYQLFQEGRGQPLLFALVQVVKD